jgi:hypothetical protein
MRSGYLINDKYMAGTPERTIRRGTILMCLTVLLAAVQSILLHLATTDYGHRTNLVYVVIEILTLELTISLGLKNKWTRILLMILTIWETILAFQETGTSGPDYLLMKIIWIVRVYVILGLFSRTMNRYYRAHD